MRSPLAQLLLLVLALLAGACGPPIEPGEPDAGVEGVDAGGGTVGVDAGTELEQDAGVTEEDAGVGLPPETTLTSAPSGTSAQTTATLEFTSDLAGAGFGCSLDGTPFSTCTSPVELTNLADGLHRFRVRATAAGLTDLTPATATWTVDTTPPTAQITSGPFAVVRDTDATFEFTSSEAGSTFECALDAAALAPCTSPAHYTGLSLGQHTFRLRATDGVGNVQPTPLEVVWTIDPTAVTRLRIVAANLTSGNLQSYDPGHGLRILEGLDPDVVLIQEMNYGDKEPATFDAMVSTTFGAGFYWHREPYKQIPNGVISRYPIAAAGVWDDPRVDNREFAWARIDLPGPIDLWAVSLHLLTSSSSERNAEASALVSLIKAQIPADDYLVIGGDLNTDSRTEACINTLSQVVSTTGPWPVDQSNNGGTNANRSKPYDWVLPDSDLKAHQVPVRIGGASFPSGLVLDTRVYTPLGDVSPAQQGDSGASNMQHMAVVREFVVPN